ncbi:MAG: hypothetical protein F4W91_06565 [Gemmatimonadetes bacterium]|nr:hypothetical protein [Gemmatimonadota bacterium]
MTNNIMPDFSLPAEAEAIIWRIFGSGESPLTGRSTYELIEPIIRKHVNSRTEQNRAITEIQGWFDSHEDRRWLKSEMSEPIADLIIEGIKSDRSETAIWAIGSIDANVAVSIIHSCWSPEEIDSFVEAALAMLKKCCDRDEVLDPTRCTGFAVQDSIKTKIQKKAVVPNGMLGIFWGLEDYVLKLFHQIGNLIELVVELRPELFESLIEILDHPVVQARAAYYLIDKTLPLDHRKTLGWITKDSCDALIALAIKHTLNTVNRLDDDLRIASSSGLDQQNWSTELRHPRDDLNTASADLLTGLVDKLAVLDPLVCVRWIGELLRDAPRGLHHRDGHEKPLRIEQLERACLELLARLVHQSWSDDLLTELRAGLCLTRRTTWLRHLADVAWEIRDVEPARAAEIAQMTLDLHDQHIAKQLEQNDLFLFWDDWHHREWFRSLGAALAMSCEELDLPSWASTQCRELPLSVWDAEENYKAFSTADRAVQHWFLVAFHAIPVLKELDRAMDPAQVRTLAEVLWSHCYFAGQYIPIHTEALIVEELAARYAAEFGEPSGAWLLDQARDSGVGPCALWALIDQRKLKITREGETDTYYDEMIISELIRIASDRFGDGGQFDLEALRFWGQLWLLLDAIDEAEQTAIAISAFSLGQRDRADKILVLKLLALVDSKRKLSPELEDYVAEIYSQLWSSYTPDQERGDRQQIDELRKQSKAESS